jgi:ABC-type Na+ efflux pump permease subunit
MFAASGDVRLTWLLAAVPVLNITLVFGEALRGQLPTLGVVVTLLASGLYTALAIWIASRLLRREELAAGDGLSLREALAAMFGVQKRPPSPSEKENPQ